MSHSSPSDDTSLEELLRRPLPPIVDDGFSRHVLAALPSKHARSRRIFVLVGALAGVAVASFRIGSFTDFPGSPTAEIALGQFAALLGEANFLLGLSVAGVSLLYAFTSTSLLRR